MQKSKSSVCRVGYALNAKKMRKSSIDSTAAANSNSVTTPSKCVTTTEWRGGGFADILEKNTDTDTIQFGLWDPDVPLALQPDFDVIIHKLTEDIDRKESSHKMNALQAYLSSHPQTRIVDSIDNVRKVVSRFRTCGHLDNIETKLGDECPFRQPKYVLIDDKQGLSTDDILNHLSDKGITFPIICKPVAACGTEDSHCMAVIVHPDDIHLLTKLRSCVVQQYYNHDANFYKVYVIDGDVMAFRRASLPNIDIPGQHQGSALKRSFEDTLSTAISTSLTTVDISEDMSPLRKSKKPPSHHGVFCSVEFDSQRPYPTISKFLGTDEAAGISGVGGSKLDNICVQPTSSASATTPFKQSQIANTVTTTPLTPHITTNTPSRSNVTPGSWKLNGVAAASPLTVSANSASKPCRHSKKAQNNTKNSAQHIINDTQTAINTQCSDESKAACNSTDTVADNNSNTTNTSNATVCCSDSDLNAHDIESHMAAFRASAAAIRDEFGLSLFGFDVIIPTTSYAADSRPSEDSSLDNSTHSTQSSQSDTDTQSPLTAQPPQRIVVIDVNYFPSYKEVKDFPSRLKNFLRRVAQEGREVEVDVESKSVMI